MSAVATVRFTLVRSTDDEAAFSPGYQSELRQFYQLVRADGIRSRSRRTAPAPVAAWWASLSFRSRK